MHEASIAREILETVLDAAPEGCGPVRSVSIIAGIFTAIEPHSLDLYFRMLAEGTCAADARLDIIAEAAELVCTACSRRVPLAELSDMVVSCEYCGSPNRIVGGHELQVKSIEVYE